VAGVAGADGAPRLGRAWSVSLQLDVLKARSTAEYACRSNSRGKDEFQLGGVDFIRRPQESSTPSSPPTVPASPTAFRMAIRVSGQKRIFTSATPAGGRRLRRGKSRCPASRTLKKKVCGGRHRSWAARPRGA